MKTWRGVATAFFWVIIILLAIQFSLLFCMGVGMIPMWTMIEYMQLISFIPLFNFRFIPYVYDAFKPFLISHLILSNTPLVLHDMKDDYFNINYDYYWLSVAKLGSSLFLIFVFFILLVLTHIFLACASCVWPKDDAKQTTVEKLLGQFKYNAYLRFYMLTFFDLTFFSIMKIREGRDDTSGRKFATLVSYVIFVLSIVIPVFLMTVVCRRFEILKIKESKASFNTLLLKLDKQSRTRIAVPGIFFFRRILTAVLLAMPIDNTMIFLQYVLILMCSHGNILYLVATKPYVTPLINNYVLSNEVFYSAIIISTFVFSDAIQSLNIKYGAAVILIASIFFLIFANFLIIVIKIITGKTKLKMQEKEAKLKRQETKLMEEEQEEERR